MFNSFATLSMNCKAASFNLELSRSLSKKSMLESGNHLPVAGDRPIRKSDDNAHRTVHFSFEGLPRTFRGRDMRHS